MNRMTPYSGRAESRTWRWLGTLGYHLERTLMLIGGLTPVESTREEKGLTTDEVAIRSEHPLINAREAAMTGSTAEFPQTVRLEEGVCYDARSGDKIDWDSNSGQQIRAAAEQYGKTQDMSWDQLSGEFRYDSNAHRLEPVTGSTTL